MTKLHTILQKCVTSHVQCPSKNNVLEKRVQNVMQSAELNTSMK